MRLSDAYTVSQVADILGLSRAYTLQLAGSYGLLRNKFGSSYMLTVDDIDILRKRSTTATRKSKRYNRHGSKGEAK